MRALCVIAGLVLCGTAAHAADEVVATSCLRGFYGTTCTTIVNPDGGSTARIIHVPEGMVFNTDPHWGRGCRSCVDLSKQPPR